MPRVKIETIAPAAAQVPGDALTPVNSLHHYKGGQLTAAAAHLFTASLTPITDAHY